jgi:hypothetical protein
MQWIGGESIDEWYNTVVIVCTHCAEYVAYERLVTGVRARVARDLSLRARATGDSLSGVVPYVNAPALSLCVLQFNATQPPCINVTASANCYTGTSATNGTCVCDDCGVLRTPAPFINGSFMSASSKQMRSAVSSGRSSACFGQMVA